MLKTIAAGTIALAVAGTGLALAQQTPSREGPHWRMSAEDVAAFADARIAALKAGLRLTAEQEKHWPAVESALREFAKERAEQVRERREHRTERREARRSGEGPEGQDAIERLRRGAQALGTRAAALKALADAAEPLYRSLDEGQKRRFALLLHFGRGPGAGHWRWQHRADNAR